MKKYISLKTYKKLTEQEKKDSSFVVTKEYMLSSTADDDTAQFIITTDAVDREFDVIQPDGIDLSNYMNNPVVLWMHDHEKPIGKCINIDHKGNSIIATVKFAPENIPHFGERAAGVCQMVKSGFLGAVSVGVRILDADVNDHGGIDVLDSELLEFSVVTVPCNQEALVVDQPLEFGKSIEENVTVKKVDQEQIDDDVEDIDQQDEILDEEIIDEIEDEEEDELSNTDTSTRKTKRLYLFVE